MARPNERRLFVNYGGNSVWQEIGLRKYQRILWQKEWGSGQKSLLKVVKQSDLESWLTTINTECYDFDGHRLVALAD
jgi:hypothetical protein